MNPKIYTFFARFHSVAYSWWTLACVVFFAGYATSGLLDNPFSEELHLWDVWIGTLSVWFVYPTIAALVRWAFTGKFSFWP
jgi:hypothetical protein